MNDASVVAADEGSLTQAEELTSAVRRLADEGDLGYAPQNSLGQVAAGVVDTLEGRIEAARGEFRLLSEARDIVTSPPDGAEAQLTRLEQLERRIGTRQPQAIALASPLTEREMAVLQLLEGTLWLRESGQELHLSQNTIKTHSQAIP